MKKLILSLALAGAMGFYVNSAMSQASVDPGDGDEQQYCQFLDRPDDPDIDGCQVPYFNHLCICE